MAHFKTWLVSRPMLTLMENVLSFHFKCGAWVSKEALAHFHLFWAIEEIWPMGESTFESCFVDKLHDFLLIDDTHDYHSLGLVFKLTKQITKKFQFFFVNLKLLKFHDLLWYIVIWRVKLLRLLLAIIMMGFNILVSYFHENLFHYLKIN
jgi:hypothetical protein